MVCLTNAEFAASGNLDLVRVDEGADDVQTDDDGQSELSFLRLARRDWSYLYCGARSVTSDFEELRSEFPARGKSFIILMQVDKLSSKFY